MIKLKTTFVILSLLALGLVACSSDNPTSSNNSDLSESAETTGNTGVTVYRNIASFKQVTNFISGENDIVDLDIPDFETEQSATQFSKKVSKTVFSTIKQNPRLYNEAQSVTADSLIFDITGLDSTTGYMNRVSLRYDPVTGYARFFVVVFGYPTGHPLAYDSTEISADLNGTLDDDSDDRLLSLHSLKRYQEGQLIRQEEGSFIPDTYPAGTEPEGGVLSTEVLYSNSSFITRTEATLETHVGSGASYSKKSYFADQSVHIESATFNEDGTGTISETKRDGTVITGSFDSAESDNMGSYSLVTTYPDGHDPAQIEESGEFTLTPADSIISGTFERKVTKLDGTVEQESATINQTRVGNILTTTLEVENADGSNGFLSITETPDVEAVTGQWENADLTYAQFTAQVYPDESAHLEFQLYSSLDEFENGGAPINTAVFDFYPDGSGNGVVTEGTDIYDVTIHPDGSVTVELRGQNS